MNQCVTDNGLPVYHRDYAIRMNYEFLEDVYADWFSEMAGGSSTSESGSEHSFHLHKSEFGYAGIEDSKSQEAATKLLEKKNNHPLMIMVRLKSEAFCKHLCRLT